LSWIGEAYSSDTFDGGGHGILRFNCLQPQTDCLQLCLHLDHLLHVSSCSNQILRHHFRGTLQVSQQMQHVSKIRGLPAITSSFLDDANIDNVDYTDVDVFHTIWPALAFFLMSRMSFFSLVSSLILSRSNSRIAFVMVRWCSLSCSLQNKIEQENASVRPIE
jgi:hypothetical protein